jgi:hypothetical protein
MQYRACRAPFFEVLLTYFAQLQRQLQRGREERLELRALTLTGLARNGKHLRDVKPRPPAALHCQLTFDSNRTIKYQLEHG